MLLLRQQALPINMSSFLRYIIVAVVVFVNFGCCFVDVKLLMLSLLNVVVGS